MQVSRPHRPSTVLGRIKFAGQRSRLGSGPREPDRRGPQAHRAHCRGRRWPVLDRAQSGGS